MFCIFFSFKEDRLVENVEAREAQTGKTIKVTKTKKEGKIKYRCEFDGRKDKGFQFLFECDIMGEVIEKSEVYCFDWKWDGTHKSVATVILPKDYQLLYTDDLDPVEISSQSGCTSVTFERPNSESESFRFGVTFSKKGIELINEGDSKFCLGYYDEAKLAYQEAIMFYSQFEKFSGGDIDESLVYLQNRVKEIYDILQKKRTDNDDDGYSQFEDCNDNDPNIHPGAEEICDGKDNNCDEQIDEGYDKDGDGYTVCGEGREDCDDNDPKIHPGAIEPCGEDYNCDGHIDICPGNLEISIMNSTKQGIKAKIYVDSIYGGETDSAGHITISGLEVRREYVIPIRSR